MVSVSPPPARNWQAWLIWTGPLLLAAGFVSTDILRSLPHAHAAELLGIMAATCAAAALARGVFRLTWADSLAGVFALAWIAFVGPLPALATALVMFASLGIGLTITRGTSSHVVGAIAGLAAIVGVLGWLLPFPVHSRVAYLAILLAICALARRALIVSVRQAAKAWRAAVASDPPAAAAAVLVVGLASVGTWIPTVQFDDLGYHLGLPSQLAALGYYRMDAHSQMWALAPWAGDIAHAIVQVLASGEARGAVDGAWLFAIATLSWQLAAAIDLPARGRWACMALAASQPMLAALVGGMQAELPATATALALALVVAHARTGADARGALPFALLAGMLLALKTGFVAIVLPLIAILIWRRRAHLSARTTIVALLLFAIVAGSSYAYAWLLTGNPLFPLFNASFQSPLMPPANLHDPRWSAPVAWDFPWRLTFYSRDYGEGWNGLAGFTLLALIGAAPIALLLQRVRWLTLAALLSGGAALAAVHYFRYAFPAQVLLVPCLTAALFATLPQPVAVRLLAGVIGLNLLYQGASFWTLHSGAITREISALSTEPVLRRFAPERLLIATAHQQRPGANVLLCGDGEPFAAELAGHGFTTTHYDPELAALAQSAAEDSSGVRWRAVFAHANAHFAIVDDTAGIGLRTALHDARLLQQAGKAELWELLPPSPVEPDLAQQRDAAAQLRP